MKLIIFNRNFLALFSILFSGLILQACNVEKNNKSTPNYEKANPIPLEQNVYFTNGNYIYEHIKENKRDTVRVVGLNLKKIKKDGDYVPPLNLTIPSRVVLNKKSFPVTSIRAYAFEKCPYIKQICIPDSVTDIGSYAFERCPNLEKVILSNRLKSINRAVFYSCPKLTSINLPDSITTINPFAFSGCKNIQLTSLPDSINFLGYEAFCDCEKINIKKLPAGIKTINGKCFYRCKNLALENLPEGITSIRDYAFFGCKNIKLTELPDSLKIVRKYAFSRCEGVDIKKISEKTLFSIDAFDNKNIYYNLIPKKRIITQHLAPLTVYMIHNPFG